MNQPRQRMEGALPGGVVVLPGRPTLFRETFARHCAVFLGCVLMAGGLALMLALASWSIHDPSINNATGEHVRNLLGRPGAVIADLLMQLFGIASLAIAMTMMLWGWQTAARLQMRFGLWRFLGALVLLLSSCGGVSAFSQPESWPLSTSLGGLAGTFLTAAAMMIHSAVFAGVLIVDSPDFVQISSISVFALLGLGGAFLAFRAPRRSGNSPAIAGAVTDDGDSTFQASDDADDGDDEDDEDDEWARAPSWLHDTRAYARLNALKAFASRCIAVILALSGAMAHLYLSIASRLVRIARWAGHLSGKKVRPVSVSRADEPGAGEPVFEGDHFGDGPAALSARGGHNGLHLDDGHVSAGGRDNADGSDGGTGADMMISARGDAPVSAVSPADELENTRGARAFRQVPEGADARCVAGSFGNRVQPPADQLRPGRRARQEAQSSFTLDPAEHRLPPLSLLDSGTQGRTPFSVNPDALEQNARILENVLEDFGVRGEIVAVRPGPVVTLYELEPAPGIKSSRVIGLADDIARSMSAISARVAVVPGKNAIGIELPNTQRQTVYLRELLGAEDFERSKARLALALGKSIGGEPVIADLARMPHLLVAGTTGSGKSVSINTMLLSLLYRLRPEQCRMIMIDPKMLELSIYEGIPHLLAPVVTDPKKAVVALKWTVREMENRYRLMSKLGVRNIDGYNQRVRQALKKGETFHRTVQTGFDPASGEPIFEDENLPPETFPYIVVIVDEMADLMMVAGKEIEGAIQRLAQMARAAGIHLVMATQRPSVDVITGTIKANFPTRISFQVTSKIDSRTILGEQGAEQLLGQGDMLYMSGGGRIRRVHAPLVSEAEIDEIVAHIRAQGRPEYLDEITEETGPDASGAGPASGASGGDDLYHRAIDIVRRDGKASTSYLQRRLSIGYNRAAGLIERLEEEGLVSAPNHAGKREILTGQDA